MGLLANSTSGLGNVSVRGLRRVPKPILKQVFIKRKFMTYTLSKLTANENKSLHVILLQMIKNVEKK
jgi:hypothetical protein